jgi:hypothetical protein
MSVQGEEMTPITKLALHVLAICPNSVSCERLFSSFGLILMKHHNRLKKTTLLDLAELKMHLRDEYVRDNVKNTVQERHFGTVQPQPQSTQPTQAAVTDSGAATADSGNAISNANSDRLASPGSDSSNDSALDFPMADSRSVARQSGTAQPSTNSSTQSLRRLTRNLTSLATAEAVLDEDEEVSHSKHHINIKQLFNFADDYWSSVDQRSAVASLELEMSFYELLDLDAAGEPDLDPDLDDTVASLFDM